MIVEVIELLQEYVYVTYIHYVTLGTRATGTNFSTRFRCEVNINMALHRRVLVHFNRRSPDRCFEHVAQFTDVCKLYFVFIFKIIYMDSRS